jgi:ABC-type oligopeptide transport system substrate-binding subunit
MGKKKNFFHIIVIFLCVVCLCALSSCGSSRNNTKSTVSYSKKRTRHQPNWNHTTSQTTTYYIKKHNTHKSHNR